MTLFIHILLLLLPVSARDAGWNMVAIRDLYYKAALSKEDSEKFRTALNAIQQPDACIKGYIAAAHMIEAKHLYSPSAKLSAFNNGKQLLESAITNDPDHAELRFLRIGIQTNTPSFLGYNKQIQADKTLLLQKYAQLPDADLKRRIREFMLKADICSEQEKQLLR